jgi:hypothetical protein
MSQRSSVLLCSVLYLLRSGLCFSLPGADLAAKAVPAGSRDVDKSSSSSKMLPWMGQSFNSKAVRTLGRVAQHPSLAIPHIALSSIAQLDFAALKVGEYTLRMQYFHIVSKLYTTKACMF